MSLKKKPAPSPAEALRANLRAIAGHMLRELAETTASHALLSASPFGDQAYFADVAAKTRDLIRAIG